MRKPLLMCLALAFLAPSALLAAETSRDDLETMAASTDALARIARRLGSSGVLDEDLAVRIDRMYPDALRHFAAYRIFLSGAGAVLVCTSDIHRGLVEDYACTPQVDVRLFDFPDAPCAFTMNLAAACSRSGGQ